MKTIVKSLSLSLLLSLALLTTACTESLTGIDDEGGGEDASPVLLNVQVFSNGTLVKAHFNTPLDPSSVTTSAFKIGSALDNGRGARVFPKTARYAGGSENTVELTFDGLGNGTHTLTVTGVRDVEGRETTGTSATFEYRITVRTPKSFIVRKIVVTSFPSKRSNGSNWDLVSIKPDIYVSFQRPRATPLFISNKYNNADAGKTYTFDRAASYNDPGVPFEADYNTTYELHLVDDDFGGNETMVTATFKFSSHYRLDNAADDEITVTGNRGFTAVIHGDWTY
ncbi:hypothetical protein [Rhodocaloribacter sp.]